MDANSFSGDFSGVDADNDPFSPIPVGGDSTVTVEDDAAIRATRSFASSSVAPGGSLTVTIIARGHGTFADVVETLPARFTYVSSSLDAADVSVSGQDVTLTLFGTTSPTTFTYTVRASGAAGSRSFSGVFSGVDANNDAFSPVPVRGDSSIRVRGAVSVGPGPGGGGIIVNQRPIFDDGDSTTRSVAEYSDAGTNVGEPVTATDPEGSAIAYALGGADAGLFEVDSSTGQITVGDGTTLDFKTTASYEVRVDARDPRGGRDEIDVTISVTNVDEPGSGKSIVDGGCVWHGADRHTDRPGRWYHRCKLGVAVVFRRGYMEYRPWRNECELHSIARRRRPNAPSHGGI